MVVTDAERTEYDDVVRQLMQKLEQLAAENAALKANNASAHQTLRAIYADSSQPATVRVRAAQAALNVETPRLESVPPPLELVATEYEPLSVVVERQRARLDKLLSLPLEERERLVRGVAHDGNGSGDE